MKRRSIRYGILVFLASGMVGATPEPQQQVSFTEGASGTWNADWSGVSARTYFFQWSLDLVNWHYAPVIEFDTGVKSFGIATQGEQKFFVRLHYVDGSSVTTLQEARDADFDNDGIPNYYEVENLFTNPLDRNSAGGDFDNDRLPDGWELFHFGNLSNDGYADPDGDGYTNLEEHALGSDPNAADTSFTDTDGDGMPDSYEANHGLNSSVDDSLEDKDGDGIPNIFEYKNGSSPSNPADKPPFDCIVDWQTGDQSPDDNVFSRINEALEASNYSPWDDVNNTPGPPARLYQLIQVKSGTYRENLYMDGIPTLLAGERGNPNGPVVIAGFNGGTVHLESQSVLDSLVITHVPGQSGTGVEVQYWLMDPGNPASLSRRRLVNCLIRGNTDTYGPGGIYSGGANLTLDHCTVFSNTGEEGATGVLQSEGSLTLNNTIIRGNNAQQPATGNTQLLVTNGATLLTSATSPNIIGDPNSLSLPGWIDQTDPKLTPAGWLKSDSPAINAGGSAANTLTPYDIHGELRNLDTAPDIGADEYQDANGANDGDGVPDWAEGPDDNDGLSALDEYQVHGTDPRSADTDNDGMNDGDELANGFDPLVFEDEDLDGMSDAWEFIHGLDRQTDDSLDDKDGDRIPNLFEFQLGTSPIDLQDFPSVTFEVNPATGSNDPDDNVFSTIGEAVSAAGSRDVDNDGNADPYPVILVRGGVYPEQVQLAGIPILLLGELGSPSGPAEIRPGSNWASLLMDSGSVVDGFGISHQSGATGSGVSVAGPFFGGETRRRRLINCIITGNTSDNAGGIDAYDCELDLVHCTVVGNASTASFPGIRLRLSNLNLFNTVIADNTGSQSDPYQQIATDSMNRVAPSETCPSFIGDAPPTPISGWIVVPYPGLMPTGYADAYSSVVDSGGTIQGTLVRFDLQGHLRSTGGIPDIGADEFIPEYTDPEGPEPGSGSSVDSDGDGIPDQWEIAHGLNPLVENPATDLQDYLNDQMGTDGLTVHTLLQ